MSLTKLQIKNVSANVCPREVLDITFAPVSISGWVIDWRVCGTGSISVGSLEKQFQRSQKNKMRSIQTGATIKGIRNIIRGIELLADNLRAAVITSYETACPVHNDQQKPEHLGGMRILTSTVAKQGKLGIAGL